MRMLNTGKGPAVRALRAQADKFAYQHEMKKHLKMSLTSPCSREWLKL